MHLKNTLFHQESIRILLLIIAVLSLKASGETVNWQGPAGTRIRDIRYFTDTGSEDALPTASDTSTAATTDTALSHVIDSPAINGFVPWIVITATDEHLDAETTGIYEAYASDYIGDPPDGTDPRTNFFIGIFDTGASAHVIGYENAVQAGLYTSDFLTDNEVEVSGVTGSVDTYVTLPYALFIDGLDALEPNAPGQSQQVLASTDGLVAYCLSSVSSVS